MNVTVLTAFIKGAHKFQPNYRKVQNSKKIKNHWLNRFADTAQIAAEYRNFIGSNFILTRFLQPVGEGEVS